MKIIYRVIQDCSLYDEPQVASQHDTYEEAEAAIPGHAEQFQNYGHYVEFKIEKAFTFDIQSKAL